MAMNSEWPFVIVRNYGTGNDNREFLRCLFSAQERHPGLVEEIWFSGNSIDGLDIVEQEARESLPFRDTCRELGIRFSYQQGITLNHNPDGKKREHLFPEDAWAMGADGTRYYGLFCANSPAARDYNRREAELILSILRPDSYWPDDDLRLSKFNPSEVCFCGICMEKFNRECGHHFTREELAAELFGKNPSPALRKEWTLFNGRSLGEFAGVFREAVDRVLPSCRLGIQTVHTHWTYDGPDFRPIIEGIAGPARKPVGVRPGAGYYTENAPREMLFKALGVGEEAARCKTYGCVAQLCYEAENWPHVSAEKSPEAQMVECALVLASGMDSLALYWGTDLNRESDENYAFYFDTLARYKPFFAAVRDAFRGSSLAGGAIWHGRNALVVPEWKSLEDNTEMRLMTNAVPVVRSKSIREFFILNERAVRELTEEDFPEVFSGPVLMDIESFNRLKERFPGLEFPGKVKLQGFQELAAATSHRSNFELFEDGRRAMDFNTVITAVSPDVRFFSRTAAVPDSAGTCVIPTEFGGNVVLAQSLNNWVLWTGYRRKAVLDALDSVIPGRMSVRLLTGGYAVNVIGRRDDGSGKTVGAFLLNISIGATPELELAIRNPAFKSFRIRRPDGTLETAETVSRSGSEIVLRIPGIPGWQPVLIEGAVQTV